MRFEGQGQGILQRFIIEATYGKPLHSWLACSDSRRDGDAMFYSTSCFFLTLHKTQRHSTGTTGQQGLNVPQSDGPALLGVPYLSNRLDCLVDVFVPLTVMPSVWLYKV